MSRITTTLKRLSICDCGFPALKCEITLGTQYDIDPEITGSFIFVCGGCKKSMEITGVMVFARGDSHEGYLPQQLFEPPVEVTA